MKKEEKLVLSQEEMHILLLDLSVRFNILFFSFEIDDYFWPELERTIKSNPDILISFGRTDN